MLVLRHDSAGNGLLELRQVHKATTQEVKLTPSQGVLMTRALAVILTIDLSIVTQDNRTAQAVVAIFAFAICIFLFLAIRKQRNNELRTNTNWFQSAPRESWESQTDPMSSGMD